MQKLVHQTELMGIPYLNKLPEDIKDIGNYNLIVDAIFGFSFKPPMREPFGKILSVLYKSNVPIFSIDIPSGKIFLIKLKLIFFRMGC